MRRHSLQTRFAFALSLILLALYASQVSAESPTNPKVADSFTLPIDNPDRTIDFDIHPYFSQGTCFGVDIQAMWHSGEDWFVAAGTTVKAVANGIVRYVMPPDLDYPGSVVIVEHMLVDGQRIFSMYGHLQKPPLVSENQVVSKGDPIGKVLYQPYGWMDNSHLHWEIRNFLDGSFCDNKLIAGPGYTYPGHPQDSGYFSPSEFVASRTQPLGTIEGIVRIAGSGGPVPGAQVTLDGSGVKKSIAADADGRYRFEWVPAGTARIDASWPEMSDGTADVTIVAGATAQAAEIFLAPPTPAAPVARSVTPDPSVSPVLSVLRQSGALAIPLAARRSLPGTGAGSPAQASAGSSPDQGEIPEDILRRFGDLQMKMRP